MDGKPQKVMINVSTASIVKVAVAVLGVWFLYQVQYVLGLLFVTILLTTALTPAVSWLQRHRVPRAFGVLILYLAAFLLVSLAVVLLAPLVVDEIGSISRNFPVYWDRLMAGWAGVDPRFHQTVQQALQSLESNFRQSAGSVFGLISSIFGNLLSFILVLVMTFYLLVQEDALKRAVQLVTPPHRRAYVGDLIERIQQRLSLWLRGVLLLGVIIGALTMVGLRILNVRYFLVLALVAGILELIPYVGPALAAIPAVFFAVTESPWKGLAVLVLYWLIQQLENHLIVPRVMAKAVGLNPFVIIVVILTGATFAGFVGVLIAVPTAAAVTVWLKDVTDAAHRASRPANVPGADATP